MKNIPNLFIIGAPKSATTAFTKNIARHNEIFISKQKEPRFINYTKLTKNPIRHCQDNYSYSIFKVKFGRCLNDFETTLVNEPV